MRITDARTGHHTEIHPAHRGLLRACVHAGRPGRPFDLSDLRALLATDVLLRVAELGGTQVITSLLLPDASEEEVKALTRDAELLGVHPPAGQTTTSRADLHVAAHQVHVQDAHDGPRIEVGPVNAPFFPGSPHLPGPLGNLPSDGPEPLAVRLALLGQSHSAPAELTATTLAQAQGTLDRWRHLVARLAQAPSRPLLTDAVQAALGGFEDDLDASPALGALHHLETRTDLPAGAVFETFVRLDQVLGLELAREIGHLLP